MNNKTMKNQVREYLNYRRTLGFKLQIEGQQLMQFANFADSKNHQGPLTETLAIEWATSSKKHSRFTWARRIEILRCFAKYCYIIEPETYIPGKGIFGSAHRRITPYIYSDQEIQLLLDVTKQLIPLNGLRPISFHCLWGLLLATGLRISEAIKLTQNDVDLEQGVIYIKQTKFYKSRIIPVHSSTVEALSNYKKLCKQHVCESKIQTFFIIDKGEPITYRATRHAFFRLRKLLGWDIKKQDKLPRIYDLRHTFVCRRLLAWYEQGVDIFLVLPYLSTYLGHVKVSDTYWYITGIPQLMEIAANRFKQYMHT